MEYYWKYASKGPYILASNLKKDGYDVKFVPIAQYQNFDDKEIYVKAGESIDIASYECAEGITKMRDALEMGINGGSCSKSSKKRFRK